MKSSDDKCAMLQKKYRIIHIIEDNQWLFTICYITIANILMHKEILVDKEAI